MVMAMKATPATRSEHKQLNLPGRRKALSLSLENIADSTKISIRFLRAIEDEEFEKLPGGIFNTSYLRQYAPALGGRVCGVFERWAPALVSGAGRSGTLASATAYPPWAWVYYPSVCTPT